MVVAIGALTKINIRQEWDTIYVYVYMLNKMLCSQQHVLGFQLKEALSIRQCAHASVVLRKCFKPKLIRYFTFMIGRILMQINAPNMKEFRADFGGACAELICLIQMPNGLYLPKGLLLLMCLMKRVIQSHKRVVKSALR